MSGILGVNDPYIIPGTIGGGSSLPADSAGYLYNDGSGNLSYDTAPTPEPAGSTTQIQYNKAGVMSASANLTYDESNLTLVDGALRSIVTWDDYTYGSAIKYGTVSQLILKNPTEGYGSVSFYGQWFQVLNGATNEKRSQTVVANYANISLSDGSVDETDYAYGWFRVSGTANVLEGETVTIGSTVYTFRATLASEGDVKISTTLLLSLTNLMYAINGTGTVGVNHQVTAAHADVECTGVYASTVNLKARVAGSAAEAIGLSETSGRLTRSAATMLRESANKYSKVYGFEHAIAVTKGSAQAVKGYTSIVNVGDSTADRTVGSAWGIEQQIAIAALDKTISRGTLKGAYIGCYHNGGLATSQYGVDVDMTVTDDGTGNIAAVTGDVAGLRITMTPGGTPVIGGAVYGIYVSDVSGFTTPSGGAYGLYVAGATQNNYIAGNLEVAGTLTANLVAVGSTLAEALVAMGLDPSLATLTLPDNVTVSDFAKTLLDDADAAAARATLGVSAEVPDATETVKGIAEIATQSEADAGAFDDKIITPKKLISAKPVYRKNVIINGAMEIVQRGTSFTGMSSGQFVVDRFGYVKSGTISAVHSGGQEYDAPSGLGLNYCLRVTCTTADTSIGADEYAGIFYNVEGFDFARFAGRQAVLSFWVKATKTGTYSIGLRNCNNDRVYIMEYSVTQANTWEFISKPINFDYSGGTWNYTNGRGICIQWNLACGSTYKTSTLGSWLSTFYLAGSNQVNACDSTSNVFKLTGVQLEIGETATPFEFRSFADELRLCQRYYEKSYATGTAPGTATQHGCAYIPVISTSEVPGQRFKVEKRAAPTMTIYSPVDGASGYVYSNGSDRVASSVGYVETSGFGFISSSSAALTTPTQYHWVVDAEL